MWKVKENSAGMQIQFKHHLCSASFQDVGSYGSHQLPVFCTIIMCIDIIFTNSFYDLLVKLKKSLEQEYKELCCLKLLHR